MPPKIRLLPSELDFDVPDEFEAEVDKDMDDEMERLAEERLESEKAEAIMEMSDLDLDEEVKYVQGHLDWIDRFVNDVSDKALTLSERLQSMTEGSIGESELRSISKESEELKLRLSVVFVKLKASGILKDIEYAEKK